MPVMPRVHRQKQRNFSSLQRRKRPLSQKGWVDYSRFVSIGLMVTLLIFDAQESILALEGIN